MKTILLALCVTAACTDTPPIETEPATFTARIRGPLAASTVDQSQGYHDQVAAQGEPGANAAGDFAHQVGLGTLGTATNGFLAIDQWRDSAKAIAFYANPDFQGALAPLFAAPPDVQLFERHAEWASWGEMGAGQLAGQPHWFVTVQGRLADPDVAVNQAKHDEIAGGAEAMARAAGDLAHLPHLAIDDDREFFNVDVWSNEQGILATFSDPGFKAALGSLFASPPDVRIYASTDWYQWYAP